MATVIQLDIKPNGEANILRDDKESERGIAALNSTTIKPDESHSNECIQLAAHTPN